MKSIMLPLTRESDADALAAVAAPLAKHFDAKVTGLFVRRDPKHAIPLLGEGLTADMIQDMCDATEREGMRYAAEAEAAFSAAMEAAAVPIDDGSAASAGARAAWRVIVGDVNVHVGRCARTADFSICERPQGKNSAQAEIFNELVFRSGRSVLMVPDTHKGPLFDKILIAWNGRAECARAIGGALPLLSSAGSVHLLQIGDIGEDRPALGDIAAYLADHGVASEQIHEPGGNMSVGEAVHKKAMEIGADTIVIGAFSTARWRELILGGVTRHLIETSQIPIYMSH